MVARLLSKRPWQWIYWLKESRNDINVMSYEVRLIEESVNSMSIGKVTATINHAR